MSHLRSRFIEDLSAWKPAIRSRAQLRSAPKRHMTDPTLAAAALGTSGYGYEHPEGVSVVPVTTLGS